jgi:hypothetical protein
MIAAVTYSTDDYESMRKLNVKSAYSKGKADLVFEFTPNDIDEEFKRVNKKILIKKRGAGLWLWKPYVIYKALSLINDGDYLIYSEAASIYQNKIQYLVDALKLTNQEIMVFELPLISKQWTKKETFIRMDCFHQGFEDRNQIGASFILMRKGEKAVSFVKEYLSACCDEIIISSEQFDHTIINSKEFLAHREDQSVFSILCMKYKLEPFRDPSQLGNRPWEYIASKDFLYNPVQYLNSNYPIIFQHTRFKIGNLYILKEIIKRFLAIFPLYAKWEISRRLNILKQQQE